MPTCDRLSTSRVDAKLKEPEETKLLAGEQMGSGEAAAKLKEQQGTESQAVEDMKALEKEKEDKAEAIQTAPEPKGVEEKVEKAKAMQAAPEPTSAEPTKAKDPVETEKVEKSADAAAEAAAVKQAECCIIL